MGGVHDNQRSSFGVPHPQRPLSVLPPKIVPLTQRQKNLVTYLKETEGKTSIIAPGYFVFSCGGKLIFGFGASYTVKGVCANDVTTIGIGAGLCGFGFICILIVAFGFGAACSRIDKMRGILFKCISITAALLIAAGYAVNQYYISTHHSLMDIRLSFIPLFLGAALLVISLSNFTAYTELVRGVTPGREWKPTVPLERRPLVAMCFLGPGLGTVFAGWITGEKGEWDVGFNAAVLTCGMGFLYCGVALFWSDHLRREAEWAEKTMMVEDYRIRPTSDIAILEDKSCVQDINTLHHQHQSFLQSE